MKKYSLVILLILVIGASGLFAGSSNVSGNIDLFSSYIWRGWDLNPTHEPVMQPSLTYTFGDSGFSANFWFSISSVNKELDEMDVTLSYDLKISENIAISAGFIHYAWYLAKNFNFDDNTTQEFYLTAAFPKLPFSPAFSVYYDFHNGDGWYAVVSVGQALKLGGKTDADLSASLGYNGGQFLDDDADTGFSDLTIKLAIPLKVESATVTPFAAYTFVLLDDISEDNHFWVGLSVSF
jgi:uncharacterized protein (TIGR02001 family)